VQLNKPINTQSTTRTYDLVAYCDTRPENEVRWCYETRAPWGGATRHGGCGC